MTAREAPRRSNCTPLTLKLAPNCLTESALGAVYVQLTPAKGAAGVKSPMAMRGKKLIPSKISLELMSSWSSPVHVARLRSSSIAR